LDDFAAGAAGFASLGGACGVGAAEVDDVVEGASAVEADASLVRRVFVVEDSDFEDPCERSFSNRSPILASSLSIVIGTPRWIV
jgi:hypothetical protein